MSVTFSPEAIERLEGQLQYIRDQRAPEAAERLRIRVLAFLSETLSSFPRAGHKVDGDLWECWIPGTKLVVWYEINDDDIVVMSVWHTAQDRTPGRQEEG